MDWKALTAGMGHIDPDLPSRAFRLSCLAAVRDGTQYDHLQHSFAEEENEGGEYIPLHRRRPSARSGLCRKVVDDSVALLFSEGHFPKVSATDKTTVAALTDLVRVENLNELMIEAAEKGSVGSVAIQMQTFDGEVFFRVVETAYLTPVWNPRNPRRLSQVIERYKVPARDLIAMGYLVDPDLGDHWFQRIWDEKSETWYQPWPVSKLKAENGQPFSPAVDADRTVTHGLGFVPLRWIRNLPGGDTTDGAATFAAGLDTVIELDYLLSQAGRALRYAGDPTLVLKDGSAGAANPDGGSASTGGASRALMVPPDGDAKLLEINGSAAAASLEHVRALREIALNAMHGNRAEASKLSSATSGRAMELMHQDLIWLADKLRQNYGEGGLLDLYRMVCDASHKLKSGIRIGGVVYKDLNSEGLALSWPDWFPPTSEDRQQEATTLTTLKTGGLVSQSTALRKLAPTYDVEDIEEEANLISADLAASDARAIALAAPVKATEKRPD